MSTTTDQIDHYNEFGRLHRDEIISAENPDTWTTDPNPVSAMNQQMRERLTEQQRVVKKYFNTSVPVLDLGCGFGRQSYMMAKNAFKVTGVDSSSVLIEIAKTLLSKHRLDGNFLCDSVWNFKSERRYKQITLFDVVEHFRPDDRKIFMRHLAENICEPQAIVIITIPYMSKNSLKDRMTNTYKSLTSHFPFLSEKKEHPYPLPYKETLTKLMDPYFNLKEYLHNADTAFFILQRT